ncbi:MAG: C1 family peptidase [Bacteroidales bacterium]|nr:C1 family peptidase [Bacteroidales bacterium]
MKEAQVQSVVDRINEYNVRHGKLWRAGINSRALSKKEYYLIEEDSYLANIKYYIDGIYEFGEPVAEKSVSTSNFPPSFDWRYIHGGQKQYITPIKNQDSTNWCATYAALGMLEAHINLKYNDTINLDLSEPSVAYYLQPDYWLGAHETTVLNYIKNNGAIDEQSLPYQTYVNHNMPEIRPEGYENVKISNYLSMPYSWRSNTESLKDSLIKRGPCMSGFCWPNAFKSHEMLLVGYGVVTPDSFYIVNNTCTFNYVSENDSVNIGKTFWIFKDSYAGVLDWGHQGYMYLIMHNYSYMRTPYFIDSQLIWRGHTDAEIVCEDIDGDGFFNWGIGPKPSHCPSWAAAQADGDDSDDTKGPMDQYGFCSSLSLGNSVLQITNPLTIGSDYYMRNSIRVSGNGKLIIPHELHCYRGVTLTLESGTTLEIDGGLLKNIILDAKPGSSIIIKNGGRLLGNKQHGEINIPLGVNLDISEGEMKIND